MESRKWVASLKGLAFIALILLAGWLLLYLIQIETPPVFDIVEPQTNEFMAKKTKSKEPAPVKKLYLIRGEDVDGFEPFADDDTQIACVHIKRGGRVVQIDDSPEGRGILTSNIRRAVGEKATTRLISGAAKPAEGSIKSMRAEISNIKAEYAGLPQNDDRVTHEKRVELQGRLKALTDELKKIESKTPIS